MGNSLLDVGNSLGYSSLSLYTDGHSALFRIKEGSSLMPEKPTIEPITRQSLTCTVMHMSDADLELFRGLMSATFESYRRIDQLPEPALPVHYARTGGYRPTAEENPLNAWYQKCSIKGAASGPLAGKRIAIKDNVCVAGVPMMNGSVGARGICPGI